MKPRMTLLVVAGATGLATAGVVIANRFSPRQDGTPLYSAVSWVRQRTPAPIRARLSAQTVARAQDGAAVSQTRSREDAAFIGNTRTRVYHEATDAHLPAEEHRAYFTSAEEAAAVGYRPAGSMS